MAKDLRTVNSYNRALDVEMTFMREIIQLFKQKEQYQTWLLSSIIYLLHYLGDVGLSVLESR